MADSLYPDESVRQVFIDNVIAMIEEDMQSYDLKMYDVFLIWSMGKSRWKKSTITKIRTENNESPTDDGDAATG